MLKGLEMDRFWARYQKPAACKRVLDDLIDYCKNNSRNGRPLYQDTVISRSWPKQRLKLRPAGWPITVWPGCWTKKFLSGMKQHWEKTFADEMGQRLMDLGLEIFGLDGQLEEGSKSAPFKGLIEKWYLVCRGHTIAGGTVEVMKDTVARMV